LTDVGAFGCGDGLSLFIFGSSFGNYGYGDGIGIGVGVVGGIAIGAVAELN